VRAQGGADPDELRTVVCLATGCSVSKHGFLLALKYPTTQKNIILSQVSVQTNLVSIVSLKRLAERTLKENSQLRSLILSEPDELPLNEYLVRAKVYAKLLEQELRH
jgi:hypothetical protein